MCQFAAEQFHFRNFNARSHLATTTQTFHVVSTTFRMDCMATNVTVHTWRQEKITKKTSLSSSANGLLWMETSFPKASIQTMLNETYAVKGCFCGASFRFIHRGRVFMIEVWTFNHDKHYLWRNLLLCRGKLSVRMYGYPMSQRPTLFI